MEQHLINWTSAVFLADPEPPGPRLIVEGVLEHSYDHITLEPGPTGIVQHEYHPYKVYGHWDVVIEVRTPWSKVEPRSELRKMGTKGIELVGADGQLQKIDIPGAS